MSMLGFCRAAAIGTTILVAAPASTQNAPAGSPFDRLESGLWELRSAGGVGLGHICLGDRLLLAQPYHRGADCAREVISADSRTATIRYSCPGMGFGRTTIRFETRRLVQIDSQGLDRGTPFALRAQARRTGPCDAPARAERQPTRR